LKRIRSNSLSECAKRIADQRQEWAIKKVLSLRKNESAAMAIELSPVAARLSVTIIAGVRGLGSSLSIIFTCSQTVLK
jgi:Flp pilus assembly pilin Flp